jgi:hypothetical protein
MLDSGNSIYPARYDIVHHSHDTLAVVVESSLPNVALSRYLLVPKLVLPHPSL